MKDEARVGEGSQVTVEPGPQEPCYATVSERVEDNRWPPQSGNLRA